MQTGVWFHTKKTELIEVSYGCCSFGFLSWPACKSAIVMDKVRSIGMDNLLSPEAKHPKLVPFDWVWPEGAHGTKRGPDGEPTNISSYIFDFDQMKQTNTDTGSMRKFRVVQMMIE